MHALTRTEAIERGRASIARHAWSDAYTRLSDADREAPLEPEDLELCAAAASMIGKDDESAELLARAHQVFLARGRCEEAARCAFWIGFGLLNRGEMAPASGWLTRARRVLDEAGCSSIVHGYLLLPDALRVSGTNPAAAYDVFDEAGQIADRLHDRALSALACHGRGRALVRLGRVEEGVALLDEAMAAVTAGDVSPLIVGVIYCSVIDACQEIFDLRRAHEWTGAFTDWCASQQALVPYRSECLVRRAEILQMHGAWPDAIAEAERACERVLPSAQSAVGAALYQRAELHRLRGEFADAEETYRRAAQAGRSVQPGMAQLRLAQGQTDAAATAIRTALEQSSERRRRSRLLGPYVEIMLAAHDIAAARAAADELSEIAAALNAPYLHAVASHADGAVLLAEGDARSALAALRSAWTAWKELEAPYEAARTRVLVGIACRQLGDAESAGVELEAAHKVFEGLGAAPDAARLDELSRRQPPAVGGLSGRELEVLRLVAAGLTNRAIAEKLFISEKTVARHLSNIFTKLDLSSRSAATAYAYEHGLV